MLDSLAWLVLRIVFAGFFLYPVFGFLKNWAAAKQTVGLIYPHFQTVLAVMMILSMLLITLSILFGIYGHFGGLIALVYSLLGVYVHYTCARNIREITLFDAISQKDLAQFEQAKAIGIIGHVSSAQKNYVIAAVAFFFMLLGTGPHSLTT